MRLFCTSLLLGLRCFAAVEVEVYSILGSVSRAAPANTDSHVGPPFVRNASWIGAVASVTGNVVTIQGSPSWTTNRFIPSSSATDIYHVRVRTGALAGHYFVVTSNTSNTVTVDAAGLPINSLSSGDSLEITPFWTIGALYPPSAAGVTYIASSSALSTQTQLLFFDPTSTGTNRSPSATYFFYNGAWRKTGASVTTSFDTVVVYPDTYYIQRNKATATTLTFKGRVQSDFLGTVLEGAVSANDNYLTLALPMAVSLNETGLATSAFASSPSPLSRTDELLLFDPSGTGLNRSPSGTYYYYNGAWRKTGSSASLDFGSTVTIPSGHGFVIRKPPAAGSTTWQMATGF